MSIRKLIVGLFVMALVAGPVLGEENVKQSDKTAPEKAAGDKPAEYKLPTYYAIMVSELKLDDNDPAKAKIIEKIKAQDPLMNDIKVKAEDVRKKLAAAKESKDSDAVAKAQQELEALDLAAAKLRAKTRLDINEIIGADKKLELEVIQMVQNMERRLGKAVTLEEAQRAKVRDLAKGFARDMSAARDANLKAIVESGAKSDEKKIAEINDKLMSAVTEKVLTDAQKKALEEKNTASKPAKER